MNSTPTHLRIGSRGSLLALWQARHIAQWLDQRGVCTEIVVIQTQGDLDQRTAFGQFQNKELFTKEIEAALLEGTIDLAVHSLKDLPATLPKGLTLGAVPERENPLDAWVCPAGHTLESLPAGSRVATGSLRRAAQVLALRPDLQIVPLRGNVPTRIERIGSDQAEAGLLAMAGLRRLGMEGAITQTLEADAVTPAAGQGALAVEIRQDELAELMAELEDPATRRAVDAERRFLEQIGAGCRTPVGVLAAPWDEGRWRLIAMMASPDGHSLMRNEQFCDSMGDLLLMAEAMADQMLAIAPRSILDELQPPVSTVMTAPARLQGLTVILTRPERAGQATAQALSDAGADVMSAPVIALESVAPPQGQTLTAELETLAGGGGWLILPSPSAVDFFLDRVTTEALATAVLGPIRIAVAGHGSARALRDRLGLEAAFISPEPTGETLAAALPVQAGQPVLIAGSALSRPELREGLAARGAAVKLLALYRPVHNPGSLNSLTRAVQVHPDAHIVVTSPSGVDAILGTIEPMDARLAQVRWIAIGPTTHKRLIDAGIAGNRVALASEPSDEGLIESLVQSAKGRGAS